MLKNNVRFRSFDFRFILCAAVSLAVTACTVHPKGESQEITTAQQAGEIYRVQGTSCGFYAAPNAPLKMRSGVVAQTLAMV